MHRASRLAIIASFPLAVLIGGCGSHGHLRPDVPPETTIFVQGYENLSPVNHVVHLYWFGSDPDGDVVGFEYRILDTLTTTLPLDTLRAHTAWTYTTMTDSVFTIQTLQNLETAPWFEVRAVDNTGQRDPTPAVQHFRFDNMWPVVTIQSPVMTTINGAKWFRDSTFYTLTLRWAIQDIDGNANEARCRIWLDNLGDSLGAHVVPGTQFTVPTADFKNLPGTHTVYVQPIDDGGLPGMVESVRWTVLPPCAGSNSEGGLLVVDDCPNSAAGHTRQDNFYNTLIPLLAKSGTYAFVHLDQNLPFYSADDIYQTCKLFKGVIWYHLNSGTFVASGVTSKTRYGELPLLRDYSRGISEYVHDDGRMMLESLHMTSTTDYYAGLVPDSLLGDIFDSRRVFRTLPGGAYDSTATLGAKVGTILHSSSLADTVVFVTGQSGMRGFIVRDTSDVLFWVHPGTGGPTEPIVFPLPVALSVPQDGGGRWIPVTFSLRNLDGATVLNRSKWVLSQLLGPNHLNVPLAP
jgi:hypothetical protein